MFFPDVIVTPVQLVKRSFSFLVQSQLEPSGTALQLWDVMAWSALSIQE